MRIQVKTITIPDDIEFLLSSNRFRRDYGRGDRLSVQAAFTKVGDERCFYSSRVCEEGSS